jgi:zinc transporter ZupT
MEVGMSIFRFIWWAVIISICAFAGYIYGYLAE